MHVAGILNFLRLAESQGYHTEFTGPATSIADFIDAAREVDPDIIAVSYRLTPENAAVLLLDFRAALREAGPGRQAACLRRDTTCCRPRRATQVCSRQYSLARGNPPKQSSRF